MTEEDKKLKLRPLNPAPLRIPGEPLPEPPSEDIVPGLKGSAVNVNFKSDAAIVGVINGHVDDLRNRFPYFGITNSDAIRSLIVEGARSYREKFREEESTPRDETPND